MRSEGSIVRLGDMCLYPLSHLTVLDLYKLAALGRPGSLSTQKAVVRGTWPNPVNDGISICLNVLNVYLLVADTLC